MGELMLYSYMWSHNSAHCRRTMTLSVTNELQKVGKWEQGAWPGTLTFQGDSSDKRPKTLLPSCSLGLAL